MDFEVYRALPFPVQAPGEWKLFLEFVEAYFWNRSVDHPIVVELGLQSNLQKRFYEGIFAAEHIGIDHSEQYSKPDIVGDVLADTTITALKERLAGRPIDLLFMDAVTSPEGVRREWELYAPLTRRLIAIHNVFSLDTHPTGARDLWAWLLAAKRSEYRFMSFSEWLPEQHPCHKYQMGIGVVVKEL